MRASSLLQLLSTSPALAALEPFTASTEDQTLHTAKFTDFHWDDIKPSADLKYHDCYDEYKCARLEVHLDWKNESDPRTASIAIMKLPAIVFDDDPTFAGSIFTNPGGPGHAGTEFIPRISHHLQELIDKPGKKHYEIISFDPRGIGFSTPSADCHQGNSLTRNGAAMEARGGLGLDKGLDSMLYLNAIFESNSKRCEVANENGYDIFEFANTPSVVRDMIEMLDRIQELRDSESSGHGQNMELRKRGGDDVARLQYIGFSYGTVLGNYFAAMYPGRVHRMVLDSVCDVDDYATGPGWLTGVQDMDATLDQFFKGCHEAGPEVCELSRHSDRTWTDVEQRVWSHLARLDEAPIAALTPNGQTAVLKGKDFRDFIANALYKPLKTFKLLAHLLNESIDGNHEEFINVLAETGMIPNLQASCSAVDVASNDTVIHPTQADGMFAVLCTDGDDVTGKDMSFWRWYVDRLSSVSKLWGAKWAEVRFACASWPFAPNWSFKGPFTTPKADPAQVKGKPSAPLLIINNRYDPVTPATAARAVAKGHTGAQLVIQESMGHGAVPNIPSKCTEKIVSDYFDTGAVPEEETSCKADCGPWDDTCEPLKAMSRTFSQEYLQPLIGRRFPLAV